MGLAVGALEPSLPCLAPLPPLPPSTPRAAAVPDLLANSAGRSPAQYHAFFGAISGRLAASCPASRPRRAGGGRGVWGRAVGGMAAGCLARTSALQHAPDSNFSILPPCDHRPGPGAAIPSVLSPPSLAMRPPVGAAQRRAAGAACRLRPLSRPRVASSLPPSDSNFTILRSLRPLASPPAGAIGTPPAGSHGCDLNVLKIFVFILIISL